MKRITIKPWYAQKNNYPVSIDGDIQVETPKAILFKGHGSIDGPVICMRCGQDLTDPISQYMGIGPICCKHWGLPRPDQISESERDALKEQLRIKTTIEEWIPKSVIVKQENLQTTLVVDTDGIDVKVTPVDPRPVEPKRLAVWMEDSLLLLKCEFKDNDKAKMVPGYRWHKTRNAWTYPATPLTANNLRKAFGDACFHQSAIPLLELADKAIGAQENKQKKDIPDHPSLTPSWLHQKQAYAFCKEQAGAGIFMEMGAGKTKVAIDLMANHDGKTHLIVCPRGVVRVWPREFERHSAREFNVVPLTKGTARDKARQVQTYDGPFPVVFIVTYESSWREPLSDVLIDQKFDWVVLDESHRIKKPGGKASMFMQRLGATAKKRLALSGTPMSHSPMDIYGQYRFLDPGIFGNNFKRFRDRYAIMGGYQGRQIVGYQNQSELHDQVYSIAFRVLTRDVLDLLPTTTMERTFSLSPAAAKIYDKLENEAVIAFEDDTTPVNNILTQILRLQQLTSGYLPEEDGDLTVIDDTKLTEFQEVLEDIPEDEPIVVFARFKPDLDNIRNAVLATGRKFSEVSGRMNQLEEWQAGKTDVVGVQIQSGGEGEDFTRARYTVYYSVGYSLKDYEQSLKRTDRPGQTRHAVFIHLIAENTIDRKVLKALDSRKDVVSSVLGDYREGLEKPRRHVSTGR